MKLQNQTSPPTTKPVVLGNREAHILSQADKLEGGLIPKFIPPMLLAIFILLGAFLVWAALTQLTEVTRAPGEVIPIGDIKIVQHLDGGQVAAILVDEGDLVENGQTLLRIDGAQAIADLKQMEARWLALTLRAERLLAFAEDRKPNFEPDSIPAMYHGSAWDGEMEFAVATRPHLDMINDQYNIYLRQVSARSSSLAVVTSQIDQLRKRLGQTQAALNSARDHLGLVMEMLEMREELGQQQLVTRTVLLETRRAQVTAQSEVERLTEEVLVITEELSEARLRMQDIIQQYRREAVTERGVVLAELAEVEETLHRLRARVDRLDVRSPERGIIQNLQVMTTGQVIQPGSILMQVVPTDVQLEAEVRIAPRDIGHIEVGQQVRIRVSSYDYRRFGATQGTLRRISATNLVTNGGEPYFRGWVALTQQYVGDDPNHYPIRPGMSVEAEIITGHRSLLAYLITPFADILDRSFGER